MEKKIKLPQKDGAKKAAEIFENTRKKQPSDRLIKIISETPEVEINKPTDRAAKNLEI